MCRLASRGEGFRTFERSGARCHAEDQVRRVGQFLVRAHQRDARLVSRGSGSARRRDLEGVLVVAGDALEPGPAQAFARRAADLAIADEPETELLLLLLTFISSRFVYQLGAHARAPCVTYVCGAGLVAWLSLLALQAVKQGLHGMRQPDTVDDLRLGPAGVAVGEQPASPAWLGNVARPAQA